MQPKYGSIISWGVMMVITFMAGFYLGQKKADLEIYAQAYQAPRVDRKAVPKPANSERMAAILLMPRSYRPLLENFKQHKIARSITILPADISWADGKLRVQPKAPIGIENGNAVHQTGTADDGQGMKPKVVASDNPNLRGAMTLLLLRSVAAGNHSNLGLQRSVPQEAFKLQ